MPLRLAEPEDSKLTRLEWIGLHNAIGWEGELHDAAHTRSAWCTEMLLVSGVSALLLEVAAALLPRLADVPLHV